MPGVVVTNPVCTSQTIDRDKMVSVSCRYVTFAADDYFMLIDRDNDGGDGPFVHDTTSGVWANFSGLYGVGIKYIITDEWEAKVGIIKSIDSDSAEVSWLIPTFISLRDTSTPIGNIASFSFPLFIDGEISDGELTNMTDGWTETVSGLNTEMTVTSIDGEEVTPDVGDFIWHTTRVSGYGGMLVNAMAWYWMD